MKRFVIGVYVENKFGVLARVSGLFMRRGFNIDSLTVGETEDSEYSRITITLTGDDNAFRQVVSQLKKLVNVKCVKLLEDDSIVERELMLIKVPNTPDNKSEVMAATQIYRAKIIDYTNETITAEVTGEPAKIDAFIEVMKPLGILEMCRTGVVAMERGASLMIK
ncbi:MAG: acetolactate synthase small subunit [Clostridia bacterium]|nr:acetolactate synthase small subunit [Clostridia bacterium]MBR6646136.1 acetolactate synthase small subunit [Clostridia bacterium]